MNNDKEEKPTTCGYCGYVGIPVFIYGSGKCGNCKNTIDECCSGEQCERPVDNSSSE
jgi:hypothetical protein